MQYFFYIKDFDALRGQSFLLECYTFQLRNELLCEPSLFFPFGFPLVRESPPVASPVAALVRLYPPPAEALATPYFFEVVEVELNLLVSSICLRISRSYAVLDALEKSILIRPSMLPKQCLFAPAII